MALEDTKDTISNAFEKWVKYLGLGWWEVTARYYDDPGEIVSRFRQDDDLLVLAKTYADWKYAKATIDVNLPAWSGLSEEEIGFAVVHELIHILVNEMREGELHHEERVVTQLTKAVFWAIELSASD